MNFVNCNLYTFFKEEPKSIEQIFCGYHIEAVFWVNFSFWIFDTVHIGIPLNLDIFIFDHCEILKLN